MEPSLEHEVEAVAYINEFKTYGDQANGSGGLDKMDDFGAWLGKSRGTYTYGSPDHIHVPASTFFLVDDINPSRILGMINIRHKLNQSLLEHGGHIGYGIRPTERGRGLGNEILRLGLEKAKLLGIERVLLTCYADNPASAKVMVKNGAQLWDEIVDSEDGKIVQRYWIN